MSATTIEPPRARRARGAVSAPRVDVLPPHDPAAEQGVLGCILIESLEGGATCLTQCQERFGGLNPFYDLRHADIYLALSNMRASDHPIDLITLVNHLRGVQKLDQVGGLAYLATLPDQVPSAANLPYYLDIVWSKYLARQTIQHHSAVVAEVLEAGDLTEPAVVRAREGQERIERELHRGAGVTPKYLIKPSDIVEEASERFFHDPRKGDPGWLLPIDFKFRVRLKETTIMIGDDGTGKSTILLYFLLHLASQGAKCVGALMEEAADKSLWLLASQLLGQRHLAECDQSRATIADAMAWLNQRFSFYAFLGIADWRDILATFRYAAEQWGCNTFLVDSVMRIGIPDDDYATQHAAANAFAQFAMDHNAHLIYVSHENKGEGKGKKKARGSALWTAAAHNILRVERHEEKRIKIDEWYADLADARKDPERNAGFIKDQEAKIDKKRKEWDTRITLHKQRYPGSQQNAGKRFWFDHNNFQFREHYDDQPVNWLNKWKV
jgi:KaiC/GvpD/RAD55 family RecA-like ATPase